MDGVRAHFSWLPCFEYCQILIRCWRQTCHISVSHSSHQTFLMTKCNGIKHLVLIEKSSNLHIKHFVFYHKSILCLELTFWNFGDTPSVFALFVGLSFWLGDHLGWTRLLPSKSFRVPSDDIIHEGQTLLMRQTPVLTKIVSKLFTLTMIKEIWSLFE